MTFDCVAAHTIRPDLFTPDGWVLDAGCRDFTFTQYAHGKGCRIVALDADPTVEDPGVERVHFYNKAIAGTKGLFQFSMHENPEARGLTQDVGAAPGIVTVTALTLTQWMAAHEIEMWDCIKLDVEGAEYGVLANFPGPVAKQITIEFHDHHWKRPPEVYEQIFAHLAQWYQPVKFYPGDTLLMLKELASNDPVIGTPWWLS